jgi:hypothetical protein
MTMRSLRADVEYNDFEKDGDYDAVLTKFAVVRPDINYTFWHRLGRVVRQVAVVWTDGFVDWKVAKDPDGKPLSDREKIVLNFNESGITVVLRFA